ncbi:MAG: glycosyltransferase family 61 protein [Rhodobacteraceae bacterium]|nr:glycosyltransferase family 61 protein [Paracoccaceae bacterium]
MTEPDFGPEHQPLPEGGWSESMTTLQNAVVVPPLESGFVQPAGVLHADGSYCPEAAMWRKFRPLTTEPSAPDTVEETLPGRWLWGGVLWQHFGHFLVESTARLWALANLDKPVDGILFIPKRPKVGEEVRGFQKEFVHLMKPDLPIRVSAKPARVEELVVPGQGFGLGKIIAGTPKFRDAIHADFARDVQPDGPEKIYISRSKLGLAKGGLLGEERMEQYLQAEGYEIFHPQEHNLTTQLARYKAARKVVAADGSALHLFAMVGKPDQPVAMVLRRQSDANNLLARNVAHFCGSTPLVIGALRTEWVPRHKQKSSRLSFGELDHPVIGRALSDHGFISNGDNWAPLTEEERKQTLVDKGLGGDDRFVESPAFVKARIREIRRMRRERRAARDADQAAE